MPIKSSCFILFSPTKKRRPLASPTTALASPVIFGPPQILPHDITYDRISDLIGDGQYGSVYKGRCRGLDVAVKTPHKQTLTDAQLTSFRHEVEMMSKISHPNVVRFMGACTEEGKLQIVTERCRTNLESLLASGVTLSLYERMRMARDAALGMTWLHEIKMVHRDLKTANLLVDFNNRIKVADFGFSQVRGNDPMREPKGTLIVVWMAPEMIIGSPYNEKVDVYSFGIVLWEILTREKPYPQHSDAQAFCNAICFNYERPEIPPNTPEAIKRLITTCWHHNQLERCSFNDIVHNLSEIMVDCVVTNESAAKFWKKYFLERDGVEYYIFEEGLFRELRFESYEGCTFLSELMNLLLADDSGRLGECVTLERFDKVVKWFGPFYDPTKGQAIINGITDLMHKSWFHGDITSIEANSRLANHSDGTFLIRFSSADPRLAPFTLSVVRTGHVRIERTSEGFRIQNRNFRTLDEFVESNKGYLKHPCPKQFTELYQGVTDDYVPLSDSVSFSSPPVPFLSNNSSSSSSAATTSTTSSSG